MLSQKEKIKLLTNPSTYNHEVNSEIQVIETNLSFVFLTGTFAYKMKKKIQFGDILDFSTLEMRKIACENEVVLNRRLAPKIYLDVVSLTSDFKISGKGDILEYLVKMKQLKQSDLLQNRVNKGEKIPDELLIKLAQIMSDFHQKHILLPDFSVYENIYEKWDENFRTTLNYPEFPYNRNLEKRVFNFLENNKEYFEGRGKRKKIVDGHGDLILNNIFESNDEIIIFDCIEFNKMLRIQDILEEVSFLAMDLDFQKMKQKSDLFLTTYLEQSDEQLEPNSAIINFYKSYRAYVRAKVYFSQSLQEQSDQKKEDIISLSKKYMDLASTYNF